MRQTLLKVTNLNGTDEYFGKLKHLSFRVFEGEVCYFMGFNKSEIRQFIHLICGDAELDWKNTAVFVNDRRIFDREHLQSQVYVMKADNYGLDTWTVAKYLLLNISKGILTPAKMRSMETRAEDILREFGVSIDVRKKLKSLDALQRRQMEVVKAVCCDAHIVTFGGDDFFGGMTEGMIRSFCRFLMNAQSGRLGTLLIGGADTTIVSYPDFADQIYVVNHGTIVKKIDIKSATPLFSLEELVLGNKNTAFSGESTREKAVGDEISNKAFFQADSEQKSMSFPSGSLSFIISQDNLRKEHLYLELTGRAKMNDQIPEEEKFTCTLEGHVLEKSYAAFLKDRVISIDLLGTRQDVFENLSISENVLISAIDKLGVWQYMRIHYGLRQMMKRERRLQRLLDKKRALDLNINDRICLVLERWLIFRPRVLILLEPFLNSDRHGVVLIMEYIREFCRRGTAVIIIKSNTEFIESSADQVYVL